MEIGPIGLNISSIVQLGVGKALEAIVMFPNSAKIELNDPPANDSPRKEGLLKLYNTPVAILNIIVLSCSNLIVGDITSSDPYVVIKLNEQVYKTPVIYKTLNPKWINANANFLVHDKSIEFLEIEVFDKDQATKDQSLGKAKLYLDSILEGSQEKFTLKLLDVNRGTVTIALAFMKLANEGRQMNNGNLTATNSDAASTSTSKQDPPVTGEGLDLTIDDLVEVSTAELELRKKQMEPISLAPVFTRTSSSSLSAAAVLASTSSTMDSSQAHHTHSLSPPSPYFESLKNSPGTEKKKISFSTMSHRGHDNNDETDSVVSKASRKSKRSTTFSLSPGKWFSTKNSALKVDESWEVNKDVDNENDEDDKQGNGKKNDYYIGKNMMGAIDNTLDAIDAVVDNAFHSPRDKETITVVCFILLLLLLVLLY